MKSKLHNATGHGVPSVFLVMLVCLLSVSVVDAWQCLPPHATAGTTRPKKSHCHRWDVCPLHLSNDADGEPRIENGSSKQMMRWVLDDSEMEDSDFDDLFFDDGDDDVKADVEQFMAMTGADGGGPIVTLNDDDLSRLHNIEIPRFVHTRNSNANGNDMDPPSTRPARESNTTDVVGETTESRIALDVISSDLSYFYLRDELGLSEDVMWKITSEASSVLGFKAANIREKVQVLKSTVGLTDDEFRQLISSQPTLLQLSAKKNVSPTILFLLRRLDLGKQELKALIMGCPALLKYSIANLNEKLVFFQESMGYSVSECRKLLLSDPRLLTCSVKTGLRPRLSFLHKEVEIAIPDLRRIVGKNPRILKMSVDQNLQPKLIFYCVMTLRMTPAQVGRLLLKYPQFLDYSLDNHILPIHQYFLSLDFSTQEFARIVQRFPRLVTFSLARIKQRIGYLRFELYLEAHSIRRIIHQSPHLISLTQERIDISIAYLLGVVAPGTTLSDNPNPANDEGSDGSETSMRELVMRNQRNGTDDDIATHGTPLSIVRTVVAGLPSLLNLNIETNLHPKVEYLRESMGQEELSAALLRLPTLLGYSLENRIRPRMERILTAGVPSGKITVGIAMNEDDFCRWLDRSAKKVKREEELPLATTAAATVGIMLPESSGTTDDDGKENGKDDNDLGTSRIVEEGGRIIHWRRPY